MFCLPRVRPQRSDRPELALERDGIWHIEENQPSDDGIELAIRGERFEFGHCEAYMAASGRGRAPGIRLASRDARTIPTTISEERSAVSALASPKAGAIGLYVYKRVRGFSVEATHFLESSLLNSLFPENSSARAGIKLCWAESHSREFGTRAASCGHRLAIAGLKPERYAPCKSQVTCCVGLSQAPLSGVVALAAATP